MRFEFAKVEDLAMKRRNAPCVFANNLPRDRRNLERLYGNARVIADGMKTRPFYINLDIVKEMIESDPKFFAEFGIGLVEQEEKEEVEETPEVDPSEELDLDAVDDIPFAGNSDFAEFADEPVAEPEPEEPEVEVEPEPEVVETPEAPIKLVADMSYAELKEELTRRGIEFKGNISKKEAIALLEEE